MADEAGPFRLPDAWVHADAAPTWSDLTDLTVAVVRWRLDRWPTRERLHELDRAARASGKASLVLGLHPTGSPGWTLDRVRDVLLARGTWAPTGLLPGDGPVPPLEAAGEVALVREGDIVERFGPDADVHRVVDAMEELAEAGEVGWRPRGAAPGPWPLAFPSDVAVGGSRIAVADTGHNRVLVARPGGEILHLVGDGVPDQTDGALAEARFEAPHGVCWRGEELLVADTSNDAIRSVHPASGRVSTVARAPEGSLPAGLACTEEGEAVVALAGHGCLARIEDGELEPLDEPRSDSHPVDVVRHADGFLLADLHGPRLDRVDEEGERETAWNGQPLVEPAGLHADERVLVADPGGGSLRLLDVDAGTSRALLVPEAGLEAPSAVDEEADNLVVADGGGHHLWRLEPDGEGPPTRLRLTESPLALAEHIRLDPIEIAPGGALDLSIAYLTRGGEGSVPAEPQPPRASGPVLGMEADGPPIREEGRLRTDLVGTVAASGSLRIRWNLTGEDVGHEAAWDLPIVVRPGADERLRLALSTSPP